MESRGDPGQGGRTSQDGFTLIELLVVIIIIGILAAIAIPVFLNQREKAVNSAMKSDLRNLAQYEEAYLVDGAGYGTLAQLTAANYTVTPTRGVTITVLVDSSNGYCLTATSPASSATFWWDSRVGGLQPLTATGCPVTTTGTPGGSITG